MATQENFIVRFATQGVEKLDSATKKVEQLGNKVSGLATAILGVSFGAFITGAAKMADEMVDIAEASNLSVESVLSFQAALQDSGGKAQDAGKAITELYKSMDQALKGSDAAVEGFNRLGVSQRELQTLSEAEIFEKTLKGLAAMPAGAERTALAIDLLGKSFATVDPKKLYDELDPEKQLENARAAKQHADTIEQLEKAFRLLQQEALKILEPMARLLGETNFNADAARKAIYLAAGAFLIMTGAKVIGGIISLNKALGITAGLSNVIGKSPLGIIAKLGLAVGAGVALEKTIEELIKGNEDLEKSAKDLNEEYQKMPSTIQLPKITGGAASGTRAAEATKEQKAIEASEKRIAEARRVRELQISMRTAGDRKKIQLEAEEEFAKAMAEIESRELKNSAQKQKEKAQKQFELEEKLKTDLLNYDREIINETERMRRGYSAQIQAIYGIEQTELEKVNELITEQGKRFEGVLYKGIPVADALRKIAATQDLGIKQAREDVRLRALAKDVEAENNALLHDRFGQIEKIYALKRQIIGDDEFSLAQLDAAIKAEDAHRRLLLDAEGAYEAMLVSQGRSNELTREQIDLAKKYNELLPLRQKRIDQELEANKQLAEEQSKLAYNFDTGWNYAFNKFIENNQRAGDRAQEMFSTLTRGFGDSIVKFVQTGKLSFRDLFNDLIAQAVRASANRLLMSIIGSIGGGGFGFGSGGLFGGRIIPGFLAHGGHAQANSPYIVGEQGPELFVPKGSGTVIPNGAMGGSYTTVNYNIQAVDASSFRTLVARDPEFIFNVTEQGRRQLPMRSRR